MEVLIGIVLLFAIVIVFRRMVGPRSSYGTQDDLVGEPLEPLRRSPVRRRAGRGEYTHFIEYADAYGEITERPIRVKSVYQESATGIVYISAHCGLRDEERTFRVDRMMRVKDLTADVYVSSPFLHFANHPGFVVRGSPNQAKMPYRDNVSPQIVTPATHDRVLARSQAGLLGLIWLAAADGEVSEPEMEVLFAWIAFRSSPAGRAAEEWSQEAARVWIRKQHPILADTRTGLAAMGKAEAAKFVAIMDELMIADGDISRLEVGRAARLKAFLPAR